MLHDDAKTYTTLASSLLAITATFSNRLLSGDPLGRAVVILAWAFLGMATGAGAYASGYIFQGLRTATDDYRRVTVFLNAAVALIGLGAVALAIGAIRTTSGEPSKLTLTKTAITIASDASGAPERDYVVESMEKTGSNEAVFVVRNRDLKLAYEVTIDSETRELRKFVAHT